MEMFEEIRRDHHVKCKGIREIAEERHIHRRVVRQALASAVPPPRKPTERPSPTLTLAIIGVIEGWLDDDQRAPRKQRHTARRIWVRLVTENAFVGAESTVRRHVGRRKRERGRGGQSHVPQDHLPGNEAEADFYEAFVEMPEGLTKVYVLAVRACASGRSFHVAYLRLTQQALLDGLARAFEHFKGVFHVVRFDNLVQAVKRVLKGRKRIETDRFVALRSHYLFESVFCQPGLEGAHEKGGVEGKCGHHRRNYLVPVPKVADIAALNALLLRSCATDDDRKIEGRQRTIAEDWADEIAHLKALPAEPFDLDEVGTYTVDSKSRVKVRTNHYSVPVRLVGRRVEVRVLANAIRVVYDGKDVSVHERLHGTYGERLVLDHYLELLQHKPGALVGSRPLRQTRDRHEWPENYDALWSSWRKRHGDTVAAREIVDVLILHRANAAADVHAAVAEALRLGIGDAAALAVLLRQMTTLDPPRVPLDNMGVLGEIGSPASDDFAMYDVLLRGAA